MSRFFGLALVASALAVPAIAVAPAIRISREHVPVARPARRKALAAPTSRRYRSRNAPARRRGRVNMRHVSRRVRRQHRRARRAA